ncbi:hypothetical protein HG547_00010 [Shewanella sp. DNRA4]|uniref:hypothetical protein n=1 Tax=Shewanella sp. DNRA4 TaxID=2723055 RepID=UPI00146E999B|nr:hypothetical protein [Shewanella sp. DNRA4]NMD50030.1 hypothetical protein [Shewanella sp. DNRA4]
MHEFLAWFTSPPGATIAWFCTVVGFIFSLSQRNEKKKIKVQCESYQAINNEFKVKCDKLEANNYELQQQIISIKNNSTHDNQQDVKQEGTTNINTGVLNGNFNLNQ